MSIACYKAVVPFPVRPGRKETWISAYSLGGNHAWQLKGERVPPYICKYRLGQWTKPKVGRVFVFGSLESLNSWDFNREFHVLSGAGEDPKKPHRRVASTWKFTMEYFMKFWETDPSVRFSEQDIPMDVSYSIPNGTLVVTHFRPKELVRTGYRRLYVPNPT